MNKNHFLAIFAMVFITAVWGITFEMVQDALSHAPPFIFASLRFGIAFVLGVVYLNKSSFKINNHELKGGLLCGVVLCLGYAFQNFGLWEESNLYIASSSSTSAFITSISVILVPIFLHITGLQKISNQIWIIVILAMIGLFVLLDPFNGNLVGGDIITFGCAVSFAIHVIFQDMYLRKNVDILKIFLVQVFFVSIFSIICSLIFEGIEVFSTQIFTSDVIIALFITGVIATFIGLILMLWAQKILSATETAILLSLEPLFAALFAVFYAGNHLGISGWLGGLIIILSVMTSGFIPSANKK
ncbi:MAG: hypothetical protein CMG49_02685 [Candidatus Marinimicrobia bacterium]|nr:hypothetical protein [Candidatus Neomarinimicrobiota bacterium]